MVRFDIMKEYYSTPEIRKEHTSNKHCDKIPNGNKQSTNDHASIGDQLPSHDWSYKLSGQINPSK